MFLGDSLIVASDSLETRGSSANAEQDVACARVIKFSHSEKNPGIMWGRAGLLDNIGTPVQEWLHRTHFESWDDLRHRGRTELIAIHRKERAAFHEATDCPYGDPRLNLSVLIAGHIKHQPRILKWNHECTERWETPDSLGSEPVFVGAGEMAFVIAWRMLRAHAIDLDMSDPEGLREFLEKSVNYLFGVERPIDIWRLRDGETPEYIVKPG